MATPVTAASALTSTAMPASSPASHVSSFAIAVRIIAGFVAAPFVLFFAMRVLLYFMLRDVDGTDITSLYLPTELLTGAIVGFVAVWVGERLFVGGDRGAGLANS